MIFLFVFALSAIADDIPDRSSDLFNVFCDNCHGKSMNIIPLDPKNSTKERIDILKNGKGVMPPYNWVLKEGEAEKLILFLENMK